MNPNLTFARSEFSHRTRFVAVNDRIPRTDGHCALCSRIIERGYVFTDAFDLLRYAVFSR
jgi:hypothetical protein